MTSSPSPFANRQLMLLEIALLTTCCVALSSGCRRGAKEISSQLTPQQSHQKMLLALDEIARRASRESIYVGDGRARALRTRMSSGSADSRQQFATLCQLAKAELHLGNEASAIELYEQAIRLLPELPQAKPQLRRQLLFETAVAYLRNAETQNCCSLNSPDSCVLPIRGSGIHSQPNSSRKAIDLLMQVLAITSPEEDMHWAMCWLLNLAHMTLGTYPDEVPTDYLIPTEAFATNTEFPEFTNVSAEAGVATFSLAGGAIGDDFDRDGDIDIVVSTSDPRGQLRIFWNETPAGGQMRFSEGTEAAGLRGILGGLNLIQTDYNNDGALDIFVLRGGWLGQAGRHPNSLLRNNADGTFSDVTFAAGLASVNYPTQTATWFDFDLDGDLDLYIGNEASPEQPAPSQLFRNNGDGTFDDIAAQAGVTNDHLAKAVVAGDYDGDRYPDLYVSNYGAPNRLYKNLGNGKFEDMAPSVGVDHPINSFPCWFWDVENDGNLDLFVSAYSGGIAEVAMYFMRRPPKPETLPRLFLGRGSGQFEDASETWQLRRPLHAMGGNFGDIDNDGFLDAYLGTGWPELYELMPNVLYRNTGQRFVDVTTASRLGHLQKGHAVVFADLDQDGDQDVFEQLGGFVPVDKYRDAMFRNPLDSDARSNWLKVQLVGRASNRPGIGARIHVVVTAGGAPRSIFRHVGSGGSFGANPFQQHIGLGGADHIDRVEVFWPATGKTDVFTDIRPGETAVLMEGNANPRGPAEAWQ